MRTLKLLGVVGVLASILGVATPAFAHERDGRDDRGYVQRDGNRGYRDDGYARRDRFERGHDRRHEERGGVGRRGRR